MPARSGPRRSPAGSLPVHAERQRRLRWRQHGAGDRGAMTAAVTGGPPLADPTVPGRAGVSVRAVARWPESEGDGRPPGIPGFVPSPFGPLAAAAAERCLRRHRDLATSEAVAAAVDAGSRVQPMLFFQSVPNSIAGHIAARWRLTGPISCISPVGAPVEDGLAAAALLFADLDADEALVLVVEQGHPGGAADHALAILVGPPVANGHDPASPAPTTQEVPRHG